MADIKAMVDSKISSRKVMMFSKTYCPFCTMAKEALKHYGLSESEYEIMEIENEANVSEIQDYLLQITGGRTVPRVFINGKFQGGGSEISAFHKNGTLQEILDGKKQ